MGPRQQLVHAINEGQQAGRDRQPVTACPYPASDLRRPAWVRGYTAGRRSSVATSSQIPRPRA
ncbi:Rmf/CrpP fold protein [Streptomyces aurantiacus]|uniref:Rmf/CrpP fold protein n=1 Tax=Streptomyces aurantiacus TaxID=47760 RepID=UPI000996EBA9|nr:Rmf/CrpP fold protein [Streptomyces aurantiacus]